MKVLLIATAWLLSGLPSAGWTFAYFQRKYSFISDTSKQDDFIYALFCILMGPVAFLGDLLWKSFRDGSKIWAYGWTLNYKNPQGKNYETENKE